MRDEQLAPICRIIFERAVENKTALEDYGITNTKTANMQTAIADYTAKTPNPRTAAGNRKTQKHRNGKIAIAGSSSTGGNDSVFAAARYRMLIGINNPL